MLNIHPSILPLFPGLDTHARALAAGMAVHGCTVHEVTPELDSGPILGQAVIPVEAGRHAREPGRAAPRRWSTGSIRRCCAASRRRPRPWRSSRPQPRNLSWTHCHGSRRPGLDRAGRPASAHWPAACGRSAIRAHAGDPEPVLARSARGRKARPGLAARPNAPPSSLEAEPRSDRGAVERRERGVSRPARARRRRRRSRWRRCRGRRSRAPSSRRSRGRTPCGWCPRRPRRGWWRP